VLESCVEVEIGGAKALDCINRKLKREADRVTALKNIPPADAKTQDIHLGIVNVPAVKQQYGPNFGNSSCPSVPREPSRRRSVRPDVAASRSFLLPAVTRAKPIYGTWRESLVTPAQGPRELLLAHSRRPHAFLVGLVIKTVVATEENTIKEVVEEASNRWPSTRRRLKSPAAAFPMG
jgi:hypothetical protein